MVCVTYAAGWLHLNGHAGYAEPGKDIVCAAVSTLCEVLRMRFGGTSAPGHAAFRADAQDPVLQAVMAVFTQLEASYPGYVSIKTTRFES